MTSQNIMGAATGGVFISYARCDGEEFATRLRLRLEAEGLPFVWQDHDRMYGGHDWWLQIEGALKDVEFLVLVVTRGSIDSRTVRKEWRFGLQEGVCVFGVKGTPDAPLEELPPWMSSRHIYNIGTLEGNAEGPQWGKFVSDLRTTCRQPRVPFMAADLPAEYVSRERELQALKERLLDPKRDAAVAITAALSGAGGFGKTTLAQALCHDDDVQTFFHGGVLWTTLGEHPGDLTRFVNEMIETLGDARPGFVTVDAAVTRLRELLAERTLLLVIDDVWNAAHLRPFMQGGPHCARLITTRVLDSVPPKAAKVNVDAMSPDEAVHLLRFDLPEGFDAEFLRLASALGEWPLLLRLVNGALRYRVNDRDQKLDGALKFIDDNLKENGLVAFDVTDPEARDQAVAATLCVSITHLKANQPRFHDLAVFPEDTDIPFQTLERLWGLSSVNTERLCEQIHQLSLLQNLDLNTRTVRLHDVVRKYLIHEQGAHLPALHERLLNAHRPPSPEGAQLSVADWTALPADEPYLWDQLAYHLVESGRGDELHALFGLTTAEGRNAWYTAKAGLRGNAGYLADLGEAWRVAKSQSREQLGRGDVAAAVALEVRYGLIKSSLNSLTKNVPTELLVAASKHLLSHAEVIAYVRSMPHGNKEQLFRKNRAVVLLAQGAEGTWRDELLGIALEAIWEAYDEGDRAEHAARLAWHLPEQLLAEVLKIAEKFEDPKHTQQVLGAAAIRYAALGKATEAQVLLERLTDDYALSDALYHAGRHLQMPQLQHAFGLAQKISPLRREEALTVLLARLAELGEPAAALDGVEQLQQEHYKASALGAMAKSLTGVHFDRAIKLAKAIEDYRERISALAQLGSKLPEPRRTEFLRPIYDEAFGRADKDAEYARDSLIPVLPYELFSSHRLFQEYYYPVADSSKELAGKFAARLAELGKVSEALSFVKKYIESGKLDNVLRPIIPHLGESNFDEMAEILDKSGTEHEWILRNYLPRLAQLGRAREALADALKLENEFCRSEAVAGVAQYLDADGVRFALQSLQVIGDEAAQGKAVIQLAAYAPDEAILNEVPFYLTLQDIEDETTWYALSAISERQPTSRVELLFRTLSNAQASYVRMRWLLALANNVGAAILDDFAAEALSFDPGISDMKRAVTALAGLLPKLNGGVKDLLRQHAVNIAWGWINWGENKIHVGLLAQLAPFLIELGDERDTLGTLRRVATTSDKIAELAEIASALGGREREELDKRILDQLHDYSNPYLGVVELGEVAATLSEPVLREVLGNLKAGSTEYYISELARLASRLAELGHPEEARELARLIPQDRQEELASVVLAAAKASGGQERTKLLAEALEVACRIQNPVGSVDYINDRADMLCRLSPALAGLDRKVLYAMWGKGLQRLAVNTRAEFMSDLGALATVIARLGGDAGIVGVREAIRDAGQWWP